MKTRQGITPAVAIILLLIATVMIAAAAYIAIQPLPGPNAVAESAYSYRFQPNGSVTLPYATHWTATPTESGPYWIYWEQPTVNISCLNRTLPDKFRIDRYSKNGDLQRIGVVNGYEVPVEIDKYRIRDCLSKHATVRIAGDTR